MIVKNLIYASSYVEQLKQIGKHKKAQAFLIFIHNENMGVWETTAYYANVWNVARSTAWEWKKHFNMIQDELEEYKG